MATETMTLREDLVSRLNRRPFAPFSVTLENGQRHLIVRVAQMGIGQTIGTIGSPRGDEAWHIKLSDIVLLKDI